MMEDIAKIKNDEWLETDGLGGFASGTVSGIRTRRYHALLLTATDPPSGRVVLVNGFDAWTETEGGSYFLTSQLYDPQVTYPDGAGRVQKFTTDPWPQWIFALENGSKIQFQVFVCHSASVTVLTWRLIDFKEKTILSFRPFLSGRDYHSLQHENSAFQFMPDIQKQRLLWHPYPGVPGIIALADGEYHHEPHWYRNFIYQEERARGLDFMEDLAAPGTITWDLTRGDAICILAAEGFDGGLMSSNESAEELAANLRHKESRRRQNFRLPLNRSADAFLVKRGNGKTVIAGYPWFTDWGRDTFIALRGLCIATGNSDDARDILLSWSGLVSEGMLPNRFPDQGDAPEYNSVDASLWYVIAVDDFLATMKALGKPVAKSHESTLLAAVQAILTGYAAGTRYKIHMDEDALLAAGIPGMQLTWMDARVGDHRVTPRIGKPIELQALVKCPSDWQSIRH